MSRLRFVASVTLEAVPTRKQFIEYETQRIQIALHRRFAPGPLLWRHVGGRPCDFAGNSICGKACQPKVSDAHLPATIEHDIGRFQVTMQHALLMCGGEPEADLLGDLDALILRQTPDAP